MAGLQLPSTTSGTRVADWLVAFNSGDDARLRRYLAENVAPAALRRRPIEERLGMARDMRAAFGTVELRKVVKAEAGSVTVVFATRDGFVQLSFECEPRPPHRLLRIYGEPTEDPDLPPPAQVTEPDAVLAIERGVAEAVAADEFSGTVLVARDGKPLLLRAWGLASHGGSGGEEDPPHPLGGGEVAPEPAGPETARSQLGALRRGRRGAGPRSDPRPWSEARGRAGRGPSRVRGRGRGRAVSRRAVCARGSRPGGPARSGSAPGAS